MGDPCDYEKRFPEAGGLVITANPGQGVQVGEVTLLFERIRNVSAGRVRRIRIIADPARFPLKRMSDADVEAFVEERIKSRPPRKEPAT